MAEGAAAAGMRRTGAELLLPALATVCGLQAWRAAATMLVGWHDTRPGPATGAVIAALIFAVSLLVPIAVMLAKRLGAGRIAALAAAVLAGLRITAQIGGIAASGWFALLGAAVFAAWSTLWAALSPRGRLSGTLLGLCLAQADLALCDGLDFLYQPGLLGFAGAFLFAVPLLVLAVIEAGRAEPEAPRPVPAALAMPLALVLAAAWFCHPVRVAALLDWSLPRASLSLLGAGFAALWAGYLARVALRRSATGRDRWLRQWYLAGYSVAAVAVAAGLLVGGKWLEPAVLLCPSAVAVALAPLYECWPVGRRHRGSVTVAQASWLLAAMLLAAGDRSLLPAVAALAALSACALVSLRHLPDQASMPAVRPPRLVWLPLLAIIPLLGRSAPAPRAGWLGELPATRVISLGIGGGRDARGRPALARQAAELRALRPQLLIVRDTREGRGLQMQAVGWWLGRRLGLTVTRVTGEPDIAVLAPSRADEAWAPVANVVAATWQHDGSTLGVATAAAPRLLKADLKRAIAAVEGCTWRVLGVDGRPPLTGLVGPRAWRDLTAGATGAGAPLLLVGGDWRSVESAYLARGLSPGRPVTALLLFGR